MPSEEEKVFCLETWGNPVTLEDEDEVDVRDGANIVSAIVCGEWGGSGFFYLLWMEFRVILYAYSSKESRLCLTRKIEQLLSFGAGIPTRRRQEQKS